LRGHENACNPVSTTSRASTAFGENHLRIGESLARSLQAQLVPRISTSSSRRVWRLRSDRSMAGDCALHHALDDPRPPGEARRLIERASSFASGRDRARKWCSLEVRCKCGREFDAAHET
jgi:hypothetical protein